MSSDGCFKECDKAVDSGYLGASVTLWFERENLETSLFHRVDLLEFIQAAGISFFFIFLSSQKFSSARPYVRATASAVKNTSRVIDITGDTFSSFHHVLLHARYYLLMPACLLYIPVLLYRAKRKQENQAIILHNRTVEEVDSIQSLSQGRIVGDYAAGAFDGVFDCLYLSAWVENLLKIIFHVTISACPWMQMTFFFFSVAFSIWKLLDVRAQHHKVKGSECGARQRLTFSEGSDKKKLEELEKPFQDSGASCQSFVKICSMLRFSLSAFKNAFSLMAFSVFLGASVSTGLIIGFSVFAAVFLGFSVYKHCVASQKAVKIGGENVGSNGAEFRIEKSMSMSG